MEEMKVNVKCLNIIYFIFCFVLFFVLVKDGNGREMAVLE